MKLKKLLPRSLFGRFLLIIVIPTLIVQIVSIYVFFYVYVDVISKQLARSVVAEMEFIKNSVTKPTYQGILQDFSRSVDLYFYFEQKHYLKHKAKIADSKWKRSRIYQYVNLFPIIDPLNRFKSELSGRKLVPYEIFKLEGDNDILVTKVQTEAGIISFEVQEKRITSSTKYVFILWMFITALITSLISIAFLRNQMRPIKLLSKAAEKFGRGQDAPDFKISGSREIRSVAISFLKMKERIIRQISQRTDMLSAVSHDLRTPLTRMKLQLEMLGDSQEVSELKHDITDMEKLIEEYLNFARFEDREKTDLVNIKQFLQKIVDSYARMGKEIAVNI
ncbi:MAG TPA: histidine kinase dimerization/phospho-acceptor domain-containing protein, partial [Rickettsiales bacterium]|nr:histidine kinase dimerization/phospho-acceptor domain-containing protein [Rickettsiales bacterium]